MAATLLGPGAAVATAASVATPTTLTPALPASTAAGDILLCYTACRSSTPTVATPSGWTSLANVAATNGRLALFGKLAVGGDADPSVTWSSLTTGTSGTPAAAVCAAFRGPFSALTLDIAGGAGNGAASTATSNGGAAATTTATNTLVLSLTTRLDDAFTTFTAPAGFTAIGTAFGTTSGLDFAIHWAYKEPTAAGSQAAPNFGLTGATSFASSGVQVALVELDQGLTQALYTALDASPGSQTGPSWAITPLTANAPAIGWSAGAMPSGAPSVLMGAGTQNDTHSAVTGGGNANHSSSLTGAGTQADTHAKGAVKSSSLNGLGTQADAHTTTSGNRNHASSLIGLGALLDTHSKGSAGAVAVQGSGTEADSHVKGALGNGSLMGTGTQADAHALDQGLTQALYTALKPASGAQTGPSWSIAPSVGNAPSIGWAAAAAPSGAPSVLMGVGAPQDSHTASSTVRGGASGLMGIGLQSDSHSKGVSSTWVAGIPPTESYIPGSIVTGAGFQLDSGSRLRGSATSLMGAGTQADLHRKGAVNASAVVGSGLQVDLYRKGGLSASTLLGLGSQADAHSSTAGNRNHSSLLLGLGTQVDLHTGNRNYISLLLGLGSQADLHTISAGNRDHSSLLLGLGTQTDLHTISAGNRDHSSSLMGAGGLSDTHRKGARRAALLMALGMPVSGHGLGAAPYIRLPSAATVADSTSSAAVTPNMTSVDITALALLALVDPVAYSAIIAETNATATVTPNTTTAEVT